MTQGVFTLDLDENFPRLSKPPIVEASIHWRARPSKKLNLKTLPADLPQYFPRFLKNTRIQALEVATKVSSQGQATTTQRERFLGFRLVSQTEQEAVQVFQDGVTYETVHGYSHWDSFCGAAKDVWTQFSALAAPHEIQRLEVRFINHFPTVTADTLENILREPPTCPANLPLKEFVYQSSFDVPSYEYGVRVIKVLQTPTPGIREASGLFLDLEAYTTKAIPNDRTQIDEALKHLRWLKNKIFFSLLTETTIKTFT